MRGGRPAGASWLPLLASLKHLKGWSRRPSCDATIGTVAHALPRQREKSLGGHPSALTVPKNYIMVQQAEACETDRVAVDTENRANDLGQGPMTRTQEQLHRRATPGIARAVPDPPTPAGLVGTHASRPQIGWQNGVTAVAVAGLVAIALLADEVSWFFIACTTVLSVAVVLPAVRRARRPVRAVVVGSTACARALATELELSRVRKYAIVGRISTRLAADGPSDDWTIGNIDQLERLIDEHEIDLILMGSGGARMEIFEAMTRSGALPSAKLWELSAFYEDVFGHVPISEINNAWFQCILHPKYRPTPAAVKRALDVTVAVAVGIVALPLLLALAWIVRRDGGPALFRQIRIGEGGKPFTMYKLRTMSIHAAGDAAWSSPDDTRVTRVGRFLRRTHLDELPQLVNVLRDEMSMVGPRPEQPLLVEQLESTIPFYSRRHHIRPGITGWAQVRCGYAGSEAGTTWKLCHDLYYVKHRSIALDLKILMWTALAVVADRQWRELRSTAFVQAPVAATAEAARPVGLESVSS